MHKIVFVLSSTNTKKLEEDIKNIKDIIRYSGEVVTGAVCFKHQRQLTGYIKSIDCLDKLSRYKTHKSVKINVLVK